MAFAWIYTFEEVGIRRNNQQFEHNRRKSQEEVTELVSREFCRLWNPSVGGQTYVQLYAGNRLMCLHIYFFNKSRFYSVNKLMRIFYYNE